MKIKIVSRPLDRDVWYTNKVGNTYNVYSTDIIERVVFDYNKNKYTKEYITTVYVRGDDGFLNVVYPENLEYINE